MLLLNEYVLISIGSDVLFGTATGFVMLSSSVDCLTAGCAAAGALVVVPFTMALLVLVCALAADVDGFKLLGRAAAAAGVEDDMATDFEDDALAEAEAAGAPAPPAADVF